jgi:hypothetical protein
MLHAGCQSYANRPARTRNIKPLFMNEIGPVVWAG